MRLILILLLFSLAACLSAQQDTLTTESDSTKRGTITIEKSPPLGIYVAKIPSTDSTRIVNWHLRNDGKIYSLITNKRCDDPLLKEALVYYRYEEFIGSYVYHAGSLRIVVSRRNKYLESGVHYLPLTNYGFVLGANTEFFLCQ